ncbi:MAG: hypothetical protein ACP5I2_01895 [Fervidicoccaceae archaeon]|uniref:ATPase n=1 Tax=Fervidicoccus fontis TaxID=683846 RepID=A0A7C2UW73_9CREN|nr:MAG: hypothetical protein C0179_07840 [Fervidicoccus sp.]HEU97744.1 hypothetical protein [Fervidicoccus fontis]
MKPVVLISGLLPYDSGKTSLALSMMRKGKESGIKLSPFKPVSAHSIFTQLHSFEESEKRGYLIGNDALEYEKEAGLKRERTLFANPVDLLLSPLDPPTKTSEEALGDYMEGMENQLLMAALMRFTSCVKGETHHYLFEENMKRFPKNFRKRIESFAESVRAEKIELRDALNFLGSRRADEELDSCLEIAIENGDGVIAESFSDSLYPYSGIIRKVSSLVIVAPGKAYVYLNAENVRRAVLSPALSSKAPRSIYFLSHLKPDYEEELELGDPLKENSFPIGMIIGKV